MTRFHGHRTWLTFHMWLSPTRHFLRLLILGTRSSLSSRVWLTNPPSPLFPIPSHQQFWMTRSLPPPPKKTRTKTLTPLLPDTLIASKPLTGRLIKLPLADTSSRLSCASPQLYAMRWAFSHGEHKAASPPSFVQLNTGSWAAKLGPFLPARWCSDKSLRRTARLTYGTTLWGFSLLLKCF